MSDDDTENSSTGSSVTEAPSSSPQGGIMGQLDDYFGISKAGSSVEGEIRAGVTTFLTMAYILIVNPLMLSGADITFTDYQTGIPFNDALVATAVASFIACIIMGLWANLPFALAPGMGLNAYFLYTVCFGMGVPWDIALAAVFVEGLLFVGLSYAGARTAMINAIPKDLKIATMAGIGLFLTIIGMQNAGWIVDNPATLIDFTDAGSWTHETGQFWALIGLIAMGALMAREQKGAIMIGILAISFIGWAIVPGSDYPSEIFSTPDNPSDTVGAVFGALGSAGDPIDGSTYGGIISNGCNSILLCRYIRYCWYSVWSR